MVAMLLVARAAGADAMSASPASSPAAATVTGVSPAPSTISRTRIRMGTLCTATVEAADSVRAIAAIVAAFDEIARLERVMSSWRGDSELSRFNATAATAPFACSPDLFAALDSSRAFASLTAGAFDPTIEAFNRAWDARGAGRVPSERELTAARVRVGWRNVVLDRAARTARFAVEGTGVDLGGVGKGLALDRAAEVLRAAGVGRALLNFGGEIQALGSWEVLLADPRDRVRPLLSLDLAGGALSTSSQSERGVDVKGRHYGHILDPRTGRPVAWAGSVSVAAASGTRADALSTALLVMGRERARAFAADHPEIGVLWCEENGEQVNVWRWNFPAVRAVLGAAASVIH